VVGITFEQESVARIQKYGGPRRTSTRCRTLVGSMRFPPEAHQMPRPLGKYAVSPLSQGATIEAGVDIAHFLTGYYL
jgi:hypothetical protein